MVLRARRRRQGADMGRVGATIAHWAVAGLAGLCLAASPSHAQNTLNDVIASRTAPGEGKGQLLVEAKEIVYNNDKNTVAASGDVELYYQGRTLQADRVLYDRGSGRVFAEGNVRLTEANGAVVTGSRFELTDDFKNGFLDSLQVTQQTTDRGRPVTTRFSAPRAERTEGETTVFERGTYTACEPCKSHPERPPLWQVKAARIIHNNEEHTIYYENATLEFAGIPIAYMPYFWSPDPTVKRKTGFLAPHYIVSSSLGTGVALPFYWAIAPNYDLTLTPTYYTQQGLLGQAEWRHRLLTGSYNIRAAGIFQQDPNAFLPSPLGARNRDFRGSLESAGLFYLNDRWRWGWDVAFLTDKWFLQNYKVHSESLSTTYNAFRESISTVFLQGQGDRSWFDVRGYYFQGLSTFDWQKQLPVVHPVLDYDKRIDGPAPIGGEIAVKANVTSLSREAAAFQQIPRLTSYTFTGLTTDGSIPYSLYETCSVFQRGTCLVRGISGTSTRVSAQVSWRRTFIDPVGQTWTPFTYARVDGFWVNPDLSGYQNDRLPQFIGGDDDVVARAMPAVGLEYRYPFVGSFGSWGTQTVEPIVQVIARPNEARIGRLPNEDAQSLVFDDTNIFNWDKFSGYDRVEGGVRANVGAQYTITGPNGFSANTVVGQSYQLAGRNSFAIGDLVNTGRDSGLETRGSDYVARFQTSLNNNVSFLTRGRFDEADFAMKRFEAVATASFDPLLPLTTSVIYARYMPQPELGLDRRREGIQSSATYKVTPNWSVTGSVLLDLDRYLVARDTYINSYVTALAAGTDPSTIVYRHDGSITPTAYTLGAGYNDECTTLSVTYSLTPRDLATGTTESVRTLLVRLELRTLGQTNLTQSLNGSSISRDGIVSK